MMVPKTEYVIKLETVPEELTMFWVDMPKDKHGGEFEPPRLQGPTVFSSWEAAEISETNANRLYGHEHVRIVYWPSLEPFERPEVKQRETYPSKAR